LTPPYTQSRCASTITVYCRACPHATDTNHAYGLCCMHYVCITCFVFRARASGLRRGRVGCGLASVSDSRRVFLRVCVMPRPNGRVNATSLVLLFVSKRFFDGSRSPRSHSRRDPCISQNRACRGFCSSCLDILLFRQLFKRNPVHVCHGFLPRREGDLELLGIDRS